MATRCTERGASAPLNVLPFPQRNKGRVRRSGGYFSMGKCVLMRMEAQGEAIPPNVERIDQPKASAPITRSPTLLLALCLYFEASHEGRESVRRSLGAMAYDGDNDAIALLAFLKREA